MKAKHPQDWTAEEKLDAVLEYEKLGEEGRGKYLRETGLHSVHIERWKQQILEGLKSSKSRKKDSRDVKIKDLEKELHRKEKVLAEAAALLVLKKKPRLSGGITRTRDKGRRSQEVYGVGGGSGRTWSQTKHGL